jgi:formyltetrahydrofolate deformylase
MDRQYAITLGCADRPGIVATIAAFLAGEGGSITEAAYHADPHTGWFFTRQVVRADSLPFDVDELRRRFAAVAEYLRGRDGEQAEWRVTDLGARRRIVVLVSTAGHCLYDLLGRVASGELDVEIAAVIGNHENLAAITRAHGIPFHHVAFPAAQGAGPGPAPFDRLTELVDECAPDAVVLARFMRVLPASLCDRWTGRAINIHHSFLPSFAGAKPYHQAHDRGVKLIGATCHYITAELDAGPIIEQDVVRVDHSDAIRDLVRKGRDIEKIVLARGLRWHLEDRVLVHGGRTVVFH